MNIANSSATDVAHKPFKISRFRQRNPRKRQETPLHVASRDLDLAIFRQGHVAASGEMTSVFPAEL